MIINKRLLILFLCQAFYWLITIFGIAFSSLASLQLTSIPSLATLPVAIVTLGSMLSTFSLSQCMQRYGRRIVFFVGSVFMVIGAALCVYAIYSQHFIVFCIAHVFLGIGQASALYYRLAATDGVPAQQRGRALAWVFSGGIIAALLAPFFAKLTKDLLLPYEFAGAYVLVGILGLLTAGLLLFFPKDKAIIVEASSETRTLAVLLRQTRLRIALLNAMVGHGVMILVMVATPLAILSCGFNVAQSTSVISWHVLGMFLPAFFSGQLIDRYGARRIATIGIILLMISSAVALSDIALVNFYVALFLLGVGWNFLYLAGSTEVTQCHSPQERGKVQGFAELLISALAAVAAFSSSALLNLWGWQLIQIIVLVVLLITIVLNHAFGRT